MKCAAFSNGADEVLKCVFLWWSADDEVFHSRGGADGKRV